MSTHTRSRIVCALVATLLLSGALSPALAQGPAQKSADGYNDHQNMMDQLGITKLRPGRNGQNQTGEGFDEATANPYKDTMPDVLTMKDGTKVNSPDQWPKRRAEILEDFEREVYGRIPANVPEGDLGSDEHNRRQERRNSDGDQNARRARRQSALSRDHGEHSSQLHRAGRRHGAGADHDRIRRLRRWLRRSPRRCNAAGSRAGQPGQCALDAAGHCHTAGATAPSIPAAFSPTTINSRSGIIGLTNKGQPRKPDDWGALRAWQWGVSRLIDYFEANPDAKVDPKKVGIEGVSRYGKAAIVAEAFEPRVAVAFVGLLRRRRREAAPPHFRRSGRKPRRRRILLDGRQLHEIRRVPNR